MITFFKDSIREIKHVVWPTREETRNYFFIVVITLILFGLYLFVVSTVFTESLFALKKAIGSSNTSVEDTINTNNFIDNNVEVVDTKVSAAGAESVEPTVNNSDPVTETLPEATK